MDVLLLNGGGRRDGFTAAMCRSFSSSVESKGWGVCEIPLLELDIRHCTGCGQCCESGICTISDDMSSVYDAMKECDLLVMASPVRFSGPSSILKVAIDRFQPLWHLGEERGGYAAGMLCGGSEKPDFRSTLTVLRSFAVTAGMRWVGDACFPDTDHAPVSDAEAQAEGFGRQIVNELKPLTPR
ncbi:MAG: flavodoxin family protein [Candidatus Methanoplasma sp.]|nr:flavodoxin family protein [Candidatus Methanoplasma sp.]